MVNNCTANQISYDRISQENPSATVNRDNCHDCFEIIYIESAHGLYRVEGHEFSISPRTIILLKPFAYHLVEIDSDNFEIVSLKFNKDILSAKISEKLDNLCNEEWGRYYSPSSISADVTSVFDRFDRVHSLDCESAEEFSKALLSEIIILLSISDSEAMTVVDSELGARVAEYLNRNIERNLSLDKLARHFFISKYHLCRAFKSYSGISVHSYINHKRIMYAKQLIDSGVTASGAAEKVGFGDYSAFYRAYVKILGKSPTSN